MRALRWLLAAALPMTACTGSNRATGGQQGPDALVAINADCRPDTKGRAYPDDVVISTNQSIEWRLNDNTGANGFTVIQKAPNDWPYAEGKEFNNSFWDARKGRADRKELQGSHLVPDHWYKYKVIIKCPKEQGGTTVTIDPSIIIHHSRDDSSTSSSR